MNRVIGKEFLFTEECKERFVEIMREEEARGDGDRNF